jgi:hypothetical protein
MSLKTATLLALVGVSLNLLIILGLNLTRLLQSVTPPTPVLLSLLGALAFNGGLLTFLVVLYRKQ